jgi:hypothetical protein
MDYLTYLCSRAHISEPFAEAATLIPGYLTFESRSPSTWNDQCVGLVQSPGSLFVEDEEGKGMKI